MPDPLLHADLTSRKARQDAHAIYDDICDRITDETPTAAAAALVAAFRDVCSEVDADPDALWEQVSDAIDAGHFVQSDEDQASIKFARN